MTRRCLNIPICHGPLYVGHPGQPAQFVALGGPGKPGHDIDVNLLPTSMKPENE